MNNQTNNLPEGFKMTEIGPLPGDWSITSLCQLCNQGAVEVQNGFAEGGHNSEGNGVPHLRPFNVTDDGRIDLTQIKYCFT